MQFDQMRFDSREEHYEKARGMWDWKSCEQRRRKIFKENLEFQVVKKY